MIFVSITKYDDLVCTPLKWCKWFQVECDSSDRPVDEVKIIRGSVRMQ